METHEPSPNSAVRIGSVTFANRQPMAVIAGPCQLESREHAFEIAGRLQEMATAIGIGLVFKTSFDKANRTRITGARGIGIDAALPIFADIRTKFGLPVLTDVHLPEQCAIVAEVVDCIQIPAFLSRQTDLLLAAALTDRPVNVKKGQFLSPWDMRHVVDKLVAGGARDVLLTERGSSFGYNALVADMRSLPVMAETGAPVVFDATHAVRQPGIDSDERAFAPVLARAAVAVGIAGVFLECHEAPERAPSDGSSMIRLKDMPALLVALRDLDAVAKRAV